MRMLSTFAIAFAIYLAWILIVPNPQERINRSCQPILWVGNVFESIGLLVNERYATSMKSTTDSMDYGCRYTVWRFFYEEDYLKAKEKEREQERYNSGELEGGNGESDYTNY